jgi:hypothetical protein
VQTIVCDGTLKRIINRGFFASRRLDGYGAGEAVKNETIG